MVSQSSDAEVPGFDMEKKGKKVDILLPAKAGTIRVEYTSPQPEDVPAADGSREETIPPLFGSYSYPRVEDIKPLNWQHHKINLLALVDKVWSDTGITSTDQCLKKRIMEDALKNVVDEIALQNLLNHWELSAGDLPLSSCGLSRKPAGTVTWLHLSDLHCKGEADYDSNIVLDALWEDIKRRQEIDPALTTLNFACLTGDLAYSGTEKEYQFIKTKVLPDLLDTTGLDKTKLFVVPGNHDIDRNEVTVPAESKKKKLLRDSKDTSRPVNDALIVADKRSVYFKRLDAYRRFFKDTFDQIKPDEEGFFYVQPITLPSGITIAVLGLNSAWLSYGDTDDKSDQGRLVLGAHQVRKAISKTREAYADLLIALIHHPLEWLAEENHDSKHAKLLLRRHCLFVLQGHKHSPEACLEETLQGKTFRISARATYKDRYFRFNGYHFVKLDLDERKVTIYFRRYIEEQELWLQDLEATGRPDGIKSFTLNR